MVSDKCESIRRYLQAFELGIYGRRSRRHGWYNSPVSNLAISHTAELIKITDIGKCACIRTLGGVSKSAWSSRIRLFDPLTRKVPSPSVAAIMYQYSSRIFGKGEISSPFSFRYSPLFGNL